MAHSAEQERTAPPLPAHCGYLALESGGVLGPGAATLTSICVLLCGRVDFPYRGGRVRLNTGDALCLFAGDRFYLAAQEASLLCRLDYSADSGAWLAKAPGALPLVSGALDEQTARALAIRAAREPNPGANLPDALCAMLERLSANRMSHPDTIVQDRREADRVEKAVQYIALSYYRNLDVDAVCRHVSYSRSYFSRCFRAQTGMSIVEYINQTRVVRAKYLLEHTELNIRQAAKSVGYDDPFYFSRIFKHITGISPTQYLNKYRN